LYIGGIVRLTTEERIGSAEQIWLWAHRFIPNLKSLGSQKAIINCLHQVVAKAQEVLSKALECQELLSLH